MVLLSEDRNIMQSHHPYDVIYDVKCATTVALKLFVINRKVIFVRNMSTVMSHFSMYVNSAVYKPVFKAHKQ